MSLPLVVDSPIYVNICFKDAKQDLYFQTSDYSVIKSIEGINVSKPLMVGDKLEINGRKVEIEEIQIQFLDYVFNYEYGLVHSLHGKEVPHVLMIDVWTKNI